ncbi:hypothetical protein F4778DRAFT_155195 [Xylariomycetidae sp. FL2044]|nr:hypothetical protein F4778DRAFT_155195 [Xylariomycetidae sp. FL2044]
MNTCLPHGHPWPCLSLRATAPSLAEREQPITSFHLRLSYALACFTTELENEYMSISTRTVNVYLGTLLLTTLGSSYSLATLISLNITNYRRQHYGPSHIEVFCPRGIVGMIPTVLCTTRIVQNWRGSSSHLQWLLCDKLGYLLPITYHELRNRVTSSSATHPR